MTDRRPDELKLPDLPEGWHWAALDSLKASEPNAMTDGPFGSKLKTADYVADGAVRVVRLGNIGVGRFKDDDRAFVDLEKFEALRKHEVFAGDLLIAALAEPVGRATLMPDDVGPAVVKADCIRFKAGDNVEPRYLMYALNSPGGLKRAEELSHGVGRLRINMGNMRELPVPVAPLEQQRRIVEKIEALTAKSRRAKEALDAIPPLLERFRQSVLAAAFRGDLTKDWREQHPDVEPVGDLLRRVQVDASRTGRTATVNSIGGRAALAVGMPDTPAPSGWVWTPLTSIARLESGHTPSRKHPEWWGGDVPWIGIKDAREHHGRRIATTLQNTNADGLANSAARLLPKNTVCLSRTASVGYVVITDRPMATSQDFVNWVCSDAVNPEFLMYLFLAEGDHLLKFGKGTTHTTIYFPEVKAFHVCLPPAAEQAEIVNIVQRQIGKIERMAAAVDGARTRASGLDSAILAKAFRGELVEATGD